MSNATAAHKHRATWHVLRDRMKRARRAVKLGLPGAPQRLAAHAARRAACRRAHPA